MIEPLQQRVILVGTDRSIFDSRSSARARMIEYGTLVKELHIIIFSKKSQRFSSEKIGENIWVYPTNSYHKLFCIFDAVNIGKKLQADFVSTQDPFETGIAGLRIARKLGIPFQAQIHTDFLSPYFKEQSFLNNLRVTIAPYVLKRAKSIRVVSERIKHSLRALHGSFIEKTFVLPIWTNVALIQNTLPTINLHEQYPQFDFIVLMASRLSFEKNISSAMEAFTLVIKHFPKAGLVIVGDGEQRKQLEHQTETLELKNNVVFLGWQNELVSYYKTADLFLLTSLYEGYGLTLIEALASLCPIVSTDVGIASELLRQFEAYAISPVQNTTHIAEKIIVAIKFPKYRMEFKEQARGIIEKQHLNISKEEYLKKYQESWKI